MTIKYWLFVIFAGQMQVVGPFDGLIACEKAASQTIIAIKESGGPRSVLFGPGRPSTACLSTKHAEFKYKEPKR